jgi:hypothetical protein
MKDDRIVAVPDPSSAAWPYNDQEFVAIAAKLPSPPKGVIAAAAEYVGCLATGLLEKGAPKPNAQSEINRLAKWVSEGLELALGHEARKHLANNKQPRRFSTSAGPLMRCLHAFESEYREALKKPPGGPQRGPKTRLAEGRLVHELWEAWSMAEWKTLQGESCGPPYRGWPDFRSLCVTPLKKFGLPKITPKGW